jgi:hypothetical protein
MADADQMHSASAIIDFRICFPREIERGAEAPPGTEASAMSERNRYAGLTKRTRNKDQL